MWDKAWDRLFSENKWGEYPSEELIRFMARNFYNVSNRKDVKVLEVGCGTGANLWYLAKEGFDVTGIDGSSVGIDRAGKRLKKESLEADLKVGDIVNLPFEDNSFDCVIDNECIYSNNYEDSKKIIDEIHRVLKPKGKFFSKTFMAGSSGLRKKCGIARLSGEKEIYDLYGRFNIESIDYTIRSEKNRAQEIKEWIIVCSKQ